MKMRGLCSASVLILAISAGAGATQPATKVSLCQLLRDPSGYKGKMIRVRARTQPGPVFTLFEDCKGPFPHGAALAYPDEDVLPRSSFQIRRDQDLERFEYYLNARKKHIKTTKMMAPIWATPRYCLITVTVTGRFDAVSKAKALQGHGYGEAGRDQFEIVVESVSNPVAEQCSDASSGKQ